VEFRESVREATMDDRKIFDSKAADLARMIDSGDDELGLFGVEELAEILDHQFSAPLGFDLARLSNHSTRRLKSLCSSADPPIESFGDLLHHPSPPVELLKMTKEFAKLCWTDHDHRLPEDVATILYLLSIAVAMTKCGRRITGQDDSALRRSLEWALMQTWLDESTRALLREGHQSVVGPERQSDV
jgi:hypothetical protein